MTEIEQKQLITDLATSPGFSQAMIACSKNIVSDIMKMKAVS